MTTAKSPLFHTSGLFRVRNKKGKKVTGYAKKNSKTNQATSPQSQLDWTSSQLGFSARATPTPHPVRHRTIRVKNCRFLKLP
jgi:hypothetical protein